MFRILERIRTNKRRVLDMKGSSVLEDVSILTTTPVERLVPGKMVMINLPGNATSLTDNDGNPQDESKIRDVANQGKRDFFEFINKFGEDKIKMTSRNAETVACYYSRKVNHLIEEYNETGNLHESFAPFADLFDDLISKGGKKISVEEATKNMRNVVLRGHCFGTLVISELEQYLHIKLAGLGYNDEECAQILSAPTAIFSSSPVAIEKQPRYFKVVAYANCADKFIPTLEGVPNYRELAGFSEDDVASEARKIKEIKIENKPNYRLIVCSSLEFPSLGELKEFVRDRLDHPSEKAIGLEIQKIYRGHAFSAISDILEKSPFMKLLQDNVRKMMAKEVRNVVVEHSLDYAQRQLEEIKNRDHGSLRKHKKAIIGAEREVERLEKARA